MAVDMNQNLITRPEQTEMSCNDESWRVRPYKLKSHISINDIKTDLYKKRNNISCDSSGLITSISMKTLTNASLSSYFSPTLENESLVSNYMISNNQGNHPLSDPLNEEEDICVCYCDEDSWDTFDNDDISISSSSTASSVSWLGSSSSCISGMSKKSLSDTNVYNINVESIDYGGVIAESSTDSLIKLLNENASSNSHSNKRTSMVTNIRSSFKRIKNTIQNSSSIILNSYSLNPRTTDDVLPSIVNPPMSQEMTTFTESLALEESFINRVSSKSFKNRESRINSEFLRKYAFDYNSRLEGYLPSNHTSEEFTQILAAKSSLKKFHLDYNIYKISSMSKEKLWQSVILSPRNDRSPKNFINSESYIFVGGEKGNYSSITTSNGNYLPWGFGTLSIKPTGVLPNGKTLYNSLSPSSGITKSQFTIKGWCNPRWIDISKETETFYT